MRTEDISVLILTKNRSALLTKCLESLVGQLTKGDEVIVVNNASTDNTIEVIQRFCAKLPIKYVYSSLVGYPKLYNLAIKKSIKEYMVFFDDDCVASPTWRKELSKAIIKNPKSIIQGKIISIPKGNIYVEIMGDHYQNWIESHIFGANKLDTFDNKNLLVPRSVLFDKASLVGFNESLTHGAEDIELGKRLVYEGKNIVYQTAVVAYHHERSNFWEFVKQHIRIARGEYYLSLQVPQSGVSRFPYKKTVKNIKSFLLREIGYLKKMQFAHMLYVVFLYVMLFCIRLYGYKK